MPQPDHITPARLMRPMSPPDAIVDVHRTQQVPQDARLTPGRFRRTHGACDPAPTARDGFDMDRPAGCPA
jgi:hypothetical protein